MNRALFRADAGRTERKKRLPAASDRVLCFNNVSRSRRPSLLLCLNPPHDNPKVDVLVVWHCYSSIDWTLLPQLRVTNTHKWTRTTEHFFQLDNKTCQNPKVSVFDQDHVVVDGCLVGWLVVGSFLRCCIITGNGGKNRRRGKGDGEESKRELEFKEDGEWQGNILPVVDDGRTTRHE